MKRIQLFFAALLMLLALFGCAPRQATARPEPAPSKTAASDAPQTEKKPQKAAKPKQSSSKASSEPDKNLRQPLGGKDVPADRESVTAKTDAESYKLAQALDVLYTIENQSSQIVAYPGGVVVESKTKAGDWVKVQFPEGKEPELAEDILVIDPGDRQTAKVTLYQSMLAAGTYRIRCGVWAYEYAEGTPKGWLPDQTELGRFDVVAEFAVA